MGKIKIIALDISVSLIGVGTFFIYDHFTNPSTDNNLNLTSNKKTKGNPNRGSDTNNAFNDETEAEPNAPLYQYSKPSKSGLNTYESGFQKLLTGFEKANSEMGFKGDDLDTDRLIEEIRKIANDESNDTGDLLIIPKQFLDHPVLHETSSKRYPGRTLRSLIS